MSSLITLVMGCVVLTIVTIATGGAFLLRTNSGTSHTPIQRSFFRAGHAHAGVLVMLGLLLITVQRTSGVAPGWQWAAMGVLIAAILMPLGFFCSVGPRRATSPNRWIVSIWIGAATLVVSVLLVGLSLIITASTALAA